MSLPLATLEGIPMTPINVAARRAALSRRRSSIQQAHVLYGLDEYDPEPLGGWWTSLKRKASNVTSSVIGAAKSSGIPGVSQVASGIRAGGQVAEETGILPSFLRTKSAAGTSQPTTEFVPATQGTGLPSWALPVGILAAVLLLVKR